MKNIILLAISLLFVLTSCNQKSKEEETINSKTTETGTQLYACPMHPEVIGKQGDACPKCGMELTEPVVSKAPKINTGDATQTKPQATDAATTNESSFSIDAILSNYLKLKNALVNDDSNAAAKAGKILLVTLNDTNANSLDAKLKKEYVDVADNAKQHTKLIGDNAGKIDDQRKHFALLSKNINDLIKTFGTTQKLYQDYCPMYDEGKSGYWISETKEIKNPYYGSQMLTCGTIKKTF
jgi:hypothetical protein